MSDTLTTADVRIRSSSFGAGTEVTVGSPPFSMHKRVVRRLRSLTEHKELVTGRRHDENVIFKIPTTPVSIQAPVKRPPIRRSSSDSGAQGVYARDSKSANASNKDIHNKQQRTSSDAASDYTLEMQPYLTGKPPESPLKKTFGIFHEQDRFDQTVTMAHQRCRRNFRSRCSLPAIFCGDRNRYSLSDYIKSNRSSFIIEILVLYNII